MSVETRPMTADELLAMPDDGAHRYELFDGELMEMSPSGARHSSIALRIDGHLGNYVAQHRLGKTYGADCGFVIRRNPDTVLSPDASFVRRERVVDVDEFFPGHPDLAVEVISPSDRYMDVEAKVARYLEAGTSIVIVVNPRKQSATITTRQDATTVASDGALTGGDVVPGWSLPLRELFEAESQ